MALKATDVTAADYLRLLVLGAPKTGKTQSILATCPKPAYVINCDDQFSLRPAARVTKEFEWDLVASPSIAIFAELDKAIATAKKGVADGRYKTILVDTLTMLSQRAIEALLAATDQGKGPDGRRAYPEYERRLRGAIDRLFRLDAHVIVTAHFIDVGGGLVENQLEKTGNGIAPLLEGKARATIPAMFQDVVFLEKRASGARVFLTNPQGVWGIGCRNIPGTAEVPADIGELLKAMKVVTKK